MNALEIACQRACTGLSRTEHLQLQHLSEVENSRSSLSLHTGAHAPFAQGPYYRGGHTTLAHFARVLLYQTNNLYLSSLPLAQSRYQCPAHYIVCEFGLRTLSVFKQILGMALLRCQTRHSRGIGRKPWQTLARSTTRRAKVGCLQSQDDDSRGSL